MAFIQYGKNSCSLLVPDSAETAIAMLVPATSNSFLTIRIDNSFQLRSIRESAILLEGILPKNFIPCSLVKPLTHYKEPLIYFNDRAGNICKLNLKDGACELRGQVSPQSINRESLGGVASIEYRVFDRAGDKILGWVVQTESITTNMFVYDWPSQRYSNVLSFPKSFYNFRLLTEPSTRGKEVNDDRFLVFATGEKYDMIHCAQVLLRESPAAQSDPMQMELVQTERKQLKTAFAYFPIGGVYLPPYAYVVCNSQAKGTTMLKYNLQENSEKRAIISVPTPLVSFKKVPGLFRKFLGVVDGNMLLSYKQNGDATKTLFGLPINNILLNMGMNTTLPMFEVGQAQEEEGVLERGELKDFDQITPSLDGNSFQQYKFECEAIMKKRRKSEEEGGTFLRVETIFRVPKGYYYMELGEGLGLSDNLICNVLQLL